MYPLISRKSKTRSKQIGGNNKLIGTTRQLTRILLSLNGRDMNLTEIIEFTGIRRNIRDNLNWLVSNGLLEKYKIENPNKGKKGEYYKLSESYKKKKWNY
jgi:hypothetical protein